MSNGAAERLVPPEASLEEEKTPVITRGELVSRLGGSFGSHLFERIDKDYRRGEKVIVDSVRHARQSFSDVRAPGRARIVKAQRSSGSGETGAEEMLLIGMSDLEAVVKATENEFDWAAAFAPRPDLPTASTPVSIRSGAPGRKLKL